MTKKTSFLLAILFLGFLFFPLISSAREYKAMIKGTEYTITYDGLVPCGKGVKVNGVPFEDEFDTDRDVCPIRQTCEMPCQFCHLFVMLQGILGYVLAIVFLISTFLFAVAGLMILTASGNPQTIQNAKKIFTSAAIGLVIIFSAWIITNTIFIFLNVADWQGWNLRTGWFKINCPVAIEIRQRPPLPTPSPTPSPSSPSCLNLGYPGCRFELMGPCPSDYPNSNPVTGGVCCCPPSCLNLGYPGCRFELMGPCPSDYPNSNPVTGGVCCCPPTP